MNIFAGDSNFRFLIFASFDGISRVRSAKRLLNGVYTLYKRLPGNELCVLPHDCCRNGMGLRVFEKKICVEL